ncbi:MAG: FAD-dependent monooxygenase, partial [Candidatus Binatia bacterium]
MRDRAVDALVVGAGPVGLTMAAELVRHGVRCCIVERAAERTDKSKALVLWPRSLELLGTAGAVEPFLRAGIRAIGAQIHAEGRQLARLNVTGIASPYRFALMIPQSETERLLEAHLAQLGVKVERRVELVDFAADDEGVRARVRAVDGAGETLRADWLIGCDGAHSTVRHGLGIDFAGAAEPNDWILADLHVDGDLPADELRLELHADGILAFFPIGPQRYRIIADVGPSAASDRPADPTLAEVQALVDRRGPGGLALRDPIWLAGFRINERKVDHYRFGRVLLAGDAAHVHSPAGGQGMNTGMQDAFNLAWKLGLVVSRRGRADVLLDSYSAERSAVGDEVLRNAGAMTRLGTLRAPAAQHLRNRIMPLLASLGVVQAKAGELLTELAIHYRQSALSRDDRGLSLRARALAGGG